MPQFGRRATLTAGDNVMVRCGRFLEVILWVSVLCGLAACGNSDEAEPRLDANTKLAAAPGANNADLFIKERVPTVPVRHPAALPAEALRVAIQLDQDNRLEEAESAYRNAAQLSWIIDNVSVKTEALRRHAMLLARVDPVGRFDDASKLLAEAIVEDQASGLYANLAADLQGQMYLKVRRGNPEDIQGIDDLLQRFSEAEQKAGGSTGVACTTEGSP